MKLVSVYDLKLLLEKTDDEHDVLLDKIITYNSHRIENYLNRILTYGSYTENFAGGFKRFFVKAIPMDATKTVTVAYYSSILTEGSDYVVWYDEGIIEFMTELARFPLKSLTVSYNGGYKPDDEGILQVPEDLKYACLLQCSWDFRNRDTLGLTSVSLPDGSVATRVTDLLPSVKQILKQYRLPPYYKLC